jgi:hypothetical protein
MSCALATATGAGTFVLMIGLLLLWLNMNGYLSSVQTRWHRAKVFGGAWGLFVISLGLPVITLPGCGNTPTTLRGHEVVRTVAIEPALESLQELWHRPGTVISTQSAPAVLWYFLWNLPNMMMLISPLVLMREQQDKGRILAAGFSCAALITWLMGLAEDNLHSGYYTWSAAITLITTARRPDTVAAAGMTLTVIAWLCWSRLSFH